MTTAFNVNMALYYPTAAPAWNVKNPVLNASHNLSMFVLHAG